MTLEKAREILRAYRPNTNDESDPDVREALAMASQDEALATWLDQEKKFHAQVRSTLRNVPVPADLRAKILGGSKLVKGPWWKRAQPLLAIAASLLLLLGGLFYWSGRTSENRSFAGFRSRMVRDVIRVYAMDIITNNPAVVRQYLAANGAPADFPLPPNLQKRPVLGGARLSWQDRPVSMVCFEGPKKQTLFLFVIRKDPASGNKAPQRALIEEVKGLPSASWVTGEHIYVLAGKEMTRDDLAALISTPSA